MRQIHVVASAFGMLALAGACASPTGGATSSSLGPSPSHDQSRIYEGAARDSVIAQAVADRQGPAASIRAEVSNAADSRRLRAVFHLDDDAYVVVGNIGADGVLRIVFPVDPGDDGFVKGDRSYQTNEFFAGFNSEFRYRARQTGLFRDVSSAQDSYDGGLGYVFIVASWRPMRFDRFSTDGKWDSFEIADQEYMRDPRPAINELASLLAGENREAYTVQFARYVIQRLALTDASSGAFGSGFCSGYEPFGFASSPFGGFGYNGIGIGYSPFLSYGSNFYYRGTGVLLQRVRRLLRTRRLRRFRLRIQRGVHRAGHSRRAVLASEDLRSGPPSLAAGSAAGQQAQAANDCEWPGRRRGIVGAADRPLLRRLPAARVDHGRRSKERTRTRPGRRSALLPPRIVCGRAFRT